MTRDPKSYAGRKVRRTCLLQEREAEGRWALLKVGRKNVRVARIGPDGLTTDESLKIPKSSILDIRPEDDTSRERGRSALLLGNRGMLQIPSWVRRRYQLHSGSAVLVEEREDGFLVRPAEIVARPASNGPTLEELLAGITPENRHDEVDFGPEVGGERVE